MISDRRVLLLLGILLLGGHACAPGMSVPLSPAAPYSAPTAAPSSTPDPCAPGNRTVRATALNDYMRQFDDYASLASSVPQTLVASVTPRMESIRLAVHGEVVPVCLADLKRLELSYMDMVLQTLLDFQAPTPDAESLTAGILQSRQHHEQYLLELARVLGATLTPPAAAPLFTPTP